MHECVADAFAAQLAERLGALRVGHGLEDGVQVAPLIDAVQRDRVAELVEDALGKGARVLCGGAALDGAGYFIAPTVLAGVSGGADLLREEIFGPVAPITTFARSG